MNLIVNILFYLLNIFPLLVYFLNFSKIKFKKYTFLVFCSNCLISLISVIPLFLIKFSKPENSVSLNFIVNEFIYYINFLILFFIILFILKPLVNCKRTFKILCFFTILIIFIFLKQTFPTLIIPFLFTITIITSVLYIFFIIKSEKKLFLYQLSSFWFICCFFFYYATSFFINFASYNIDVKSFSTIQNKILDPIISTLSNLMLLYGLRLELLNNSNTSKNATIEHIITKFNRS